MSPKSRIPNERNPNTRGIESGRLQCRDDGFAESAEIAKLRLNELYSTNFGERYSSRRGEDRDKDSSAV
jgi:hypothetical protein